MSGDDVTDLERILERVGWPLRPTGRGNRERRAELAKATGLCSRCPPHSGDNAGRKPKHGAKKKRGRKP